ncbi:MAG: NTP transferase domain-containing protein [candidate division Zixibacteria bacterium]|nr:NTP transferase domain-containing protein [candidate division Zixibacteria bacterium]
MKAVIPVAGTGSRLRPHTLTIPKALVPVAGKPILGHVLDTVERLGISEVALIISPSGWAIRDYVDDAYGFRTRYAVQEEALGVGHAVYQARSFVEGEPALIVLGDTVYHADFSWLRAEPAVSAVAVKALDGDVRRYGVAEVANGRVRRLIEKPDVPPSNLVLAGVYYVRETETLMQGIETLIRDDRRTRGEFQLTDGLQTMIDKGIEIGTFPVEEWYDCGTPEQLLTANRRLLELDASLPDLPGSVVVPPVAVAPDAQIEASVIGPFVSVSPGARIVRSVLTHTIVGEKATVQDCRLDSGIVGANAVVKGTSRALNIGPYGEVAL